MVRAPPRKALLVIYGLALPALTLHALWMIFDRWLPGDLTYDTAPRWAVLGFNVLLVLAIGWRLAAMLRARPATPSAQPAAPSGE